MKCVLQSQDRQPVDQLLEPLGKHRLGIHLDRDLGMPWTNNAERM
jgi:hypothetical protein